MVSNVCVYMFLYHVSIEKKNRYYVTWSSVLIRIVCGFFSGESFLSSFCLFFFPFFPCAPLLWWVRDARPCVSVQASAHIDDVQVRIEYFRHRFQLKMWTYTNGIIVFLLIFLSLRIRRSFCAREEHFFTVVNSKCTFKSIKKA